MTPTLLSLVAPQFVIITTLGATSEDKISIMMPLGFQWPCNVTNNDDRFIYSNIICKLISIIQYVGLCVFSLPISLVMIERAYMLCLIIIINLEVWTITHFLGLGHETMVCAVCLSICLWLTQDFITVILLLVLLLSEWYSTEDFINGILVLVFHLQIPHSTFQDSDSCIKDCYRTRGRNKIRPPLICVTNGEGLSTDHTHKVRLQPISVQLSGKLWYI